VREPLFVVADGMGGHIAGDVASSTAVEVITEQTRAADGVGPDSLDGLVRNANAAIYQKSQNDPGLHGMGTTCTLLLVQEGMGYVAHVGDSRAYLFRGGDLSQLTKDHTLVGRMVREGRLTEEEAERHPQRSIITRALGIDETVDVDVSTIELDSGDRVLLCSDGLTGMIDTRAIAEVLDAEPDPQQAADILVDLANDAGGEDNITVVIVDVTGDGGASGGGRGSPAATSDGAEARGGGAVGTVPRQATPPHPAESREVDPDEDPDAGSGRGPRRRWGRRLVAVVIALAVLVTGGVWAVRYSLSNSWFVSVNDGGFVTIYQGRPEEVAGFSLSEVQEETRIRAADLPEFLHDDLEEGIKVDSLDEARSVVANYEERVGRSRTRTDRNRSN
jgi:serine/threonine protein phosphatase PrpC